jgi:predicted RNA-binding protein with PIN domain
MLRHFLIIDGYNLMHACGLARRKYAQGQLQRCRSQLIRYLAQHLTERERERTTIVFDAGEAPPGLPRQATANGMVVCFASPGKEADDTIEELIAAHSAPRQIRLVSSDHRLQKSARRRRGIFVDSDLFAAELERRGPVAEVPPELPDDGLVPGEKAAAESAAEAERWLRIFADVPEATDLPADGDRSHNSISQADVAAMQAEIDRHDSATDGRVDKREPPKNGGRRRRH